jgi:hypothetical protein
VHVAKEKRVKLDSHSDKGVLVEYGGTNQYRVWVESRKDVVSRDVIFDEKPTTSTATAEISNIPVIHDMIVQPPPGSHTSSPTPDTTEESESESDRPDLTEPSISIAPEGGARKSGRANHGSHTVRYGESPLHWHGKR